MSKSIMIEVDETTKSILELLEYRMTNGVNTTLQSFKLENNSALQGLYSQIQVQLDELGKGIVKANEKLGRNVDDLLHDLEGQLEDVNKELKSDKKEQLERVQQLLETINKVQTDWNEKLETVRNKLVEAVQQQSNLVMQQVEKRIEGAQAQFQTHMEQDSLKQREIISQLVDKQTLAVMVEKLADKQSISEMKEGLATKQLLVELEEKLASKQSFLEMEQKLSGSLNKLESNLDMKQDIQLLLGKLEKLEKEIAWANQPFYKKWFGKRGENE